MKPPPDALINSAKPGLVIAGNDQFEPGREVEKILPHEPRGDLISAGELLDFGFGPFAAFFRLASRNKPRAGEAG